MTAMNSRPSLFQNLPALMIAFGVGLCGYYGHQWTQLPSYSDEDITNSVELNLAIELQQRGPHLQPNEQGITQMREQIRAEIHGQVEHQRKKVQTRFGVGLISLILGLGNYVSQRLIRARAH